MARIVMKFGGTSVADIARIRNVARHVKREVDAGHEVAVVVSAMAGKTNELVGWDARGLAALHDAREYDAVVASGEQVTSGLLAIALQAIGVDARSWQGWQIPIQTDNAHGAARIQEIDGAFLIERFKRGPGGGDRRLPGALGRTTASRRSGAAAPIPAPSPSPRRSRPTAATSIPTSTASTPPIRASSRRRGGWPKISFEEMLEMASLGAKVLQVRSVELAMVHKVRTFVRSSFDDPDAPGMGDLVESARNAHLRRG